MYRSISLSIDRSIYLSIYLSLSVCLSIYLSICKLENEALLRDFLIFRSWTTSKTKQFCDTSSFLNWTTSKTKQFRETYSMFELDNFKNKAILRDFLQKSKVECSADSLVPMRFAIFPLHLSKVLRLPRKIDARSYEVLHLSRKIILANLQIWCFKNATPLRKSAPWPPNISDKHVFCTALATRNASLQILPSFLEMLQNLHVLLTFDKVHNPLRMPRESTSERPKVLRTRQFFALLTSKCASRHSGVHFFDIFFDISTSKSGPDLVCFVHFDFEMCFAPQRRAIFHLSSGQMAPHPPL